MAVAALEDKRPVWLVRPGSAQARDRNERILAAIRRDTPGKLPFFCECGLGSCRYSVWLTLEEADGLMAAGKPILGVHVFRELRARLKQARPRR